MRQAPSAAHHDRPSPDQPTSLIDRLALLDNARAAIGARSLDGARRPWVSVCFVLGLVLGVLLGSAALRVLLTDAPSAPRSRTAAPRPPAALAASTSPTAPVELTVRGSERNNAPFPVSVTGADDIAGITVRLRDLPEAAWFSRGERQDEHTWALRLADLDDLHLSLREGTPDAFRVIIEVASATGEAIAATVARVRLLDTAGPSAQPGVADKPASLAPRVVEASLATSTRAPARPAVQEAPTIVRPKPTSPPLAAVPTPTEPVRAAPAVLRPEGANSLGGPVASSTPDASAAPATESRTLWWKMPTPAWAPFADGVARR